MTTVGAFEAKTHLSELLRQVEMQHEKIIIQRRGKKVAMLVPFEPVVDQKKGKDIIKMMREVRSQSKSGPESIKQLIEEGRKW